MSKTIFQQCGVSVEELGSMGSMCAWNGCEATFNGAMPRRWVCFVAYWSPQPSGVIYHVPPRDMSRDAALCPKHAAELERLLKVKPSPELVAPSKGSA